MTESRNGSNSKVWMKRMPGQLLYARRETHARYDGFMTGMRQPYRSKAFPGRAFPARRLEQRLNFLRDKNASDNGCSG
ncbi:hypothetical protein GCM10019059_22770 [Camelimonas fluminis]|nr:hypothetical protein GCM10019059_22770 [Camelimonas fluminis]